MKHEIDLKKFELRTDLMIETIDNNIKYDIEQIDNIKVTKVNLKENEIPNKKPGKYITIEFEDVTDIDNQNKVEAIFIKNLEEFLNKIDKKRGLIIGLGNNNSTPDSLGPKVIKDIVVTTHLLEYSDLDDGFNELAAFSPGVTGDSGIETSDLIKNIIDTVKPTYLIVIDALASLSIERVNKTIQMSDTGIHPGSGVGNSRKEISKDTLGIPVISIGIPTVVDAVSVVTDTINYMHKNYAFNKKFMNSPINNLVRSSQINYLKEKIEINNEDKTKLLGLIGNLSEVEIRELIYEVLTPIGYNLMVTPKEIDFVIKKLSNILSNGINKTVHPKLKIH